MIKEKRTLKNNNNNLACVESKSHILNSSVSLQSLFSDNSPHLTFIKKKKKSRWTTYIISLNGVFTYAGLNLISMERKCYKFQRICFIAMTSTGLLTSIRQFMKK